VFLAKIDTEADPTFGIAVKLDVDYPGNSYQEPVSSIEDPVWSNEHPVTRRK